MALMASRLCAWGPVRRSVIKCRGRSVVANLLGDCEQVGADSLLAGRLPSASFRVISSATRLRLPIGFITSLLSRQPGPDLFLDRQPAHRRPAPVVSEQRVKAGTA